MQAHLPSEEDSSEIEQIFKTHRAKDEEENGDELEGDVEGYFPKGKTHHVIPTGYESDSDEPISFFR